MRIVFIGCVLFSKKMLEKLISLQAQVVGVVTKEASSFNSDFEDLSTIAQESQIPYRYVQNINAASNIEWIQQLKPQIIFCFGWSNLIKKELLNLTPLGVIGFHPSLLPQNRGRHPLIWAKALGLKKSGTTFFFMDEGADSGDILDQKEFEIDFGDDASVLYTKMVLNACSQLDFFLPKLQSNTYSRIKQPKMSNTWRKRTRQDGQIDFRMTNENICNLVRALSKPYAGAHCIFNGDEKKVWQVEIGDSKTDNFEPGRVLEIKDKSIRVKTANGSIWLQKHELLPLLNVGTYIK